jgi:hypothetical protein
MLMQLLRAHFPFLRIGNEPSGSAVGCQDLVVFSEAAFSFGKFTASVEADRTPEEKKLLKTIVGS